MFLKAAGIVFVVSLSVVASGTARAVPESEPEQVARLLALLFDSGRTVLARHQPLINDPAIADKNFTAATFEAEVIEEFKRRAGGIDLTGQDAGRVPDRSRELLLGLLGAGKEVIAEKQPTINRKFLGYKNVTPATWGTWTSRKFSRRNQVLLKQTALDFRNPNNAPDPFEAEILTRLAGPGAPARDATPITVITDGGKRLRLILPLYHTPECLVCHGAPKGQVDISGYMKEGHVEGESAGAISVAIPLTPANEVTVQSSPPEHPKP